MWVWGGPLPIRRSRKVGGVGGASGRGRLALASKGYAMSGGPYPTNAGGGMKPPIS